MGRTIRLIEEITGNKGLSSGISEVSDVELLVSTIPSTTKTALKRNLGLDEATTDSQLVTLIASEEFGGDGEPFTPVIEPIDIGSMQPFTPSTDGGGNDPEVGIIDFLDDPNMQEGYGQGQGQGEGEGEGQGQGQGEGEGEGEGQGQGQGEGEEEGEGQGQGEGEGEGEDDSEGQGGSEGQSEEEKQQEKVEKELLEFGYQPLFMDIKKLLESVQTEDDDGSFKYLTIEKLDYVDVHKRLYIRSDSLKYEVTVYSNDSIKPQDFQFDVLMELDRYLEQFRVSSRFVVEAKSDSVIEANDMAEERISKSEAFDTFNRLYQKFIKKLNKALMSEAELCSKFIENIK